MSLVAAHAKAASRRGIKKSRLQCSNDLIGEVEEDPWGLTFKVVTKRLEARRRTSGLDNSDRVKYILRSLFPHVEPCKRQDRSPSVVQRVELFTLEKLKRAGGMGKLLKELILLWLQTLLVGENVLSENQFGFRKGRSTVNAIQAMVNIATNARKGTGKRKRFCALMSIDIRNAFNTARWNICIEAMVRKKVPDYLLRMIDD